MAMKAGIDCTGVRMPVGSPMPTHCTDRMSSASAGSARPMLAMFTATAPPVRTCPRTMPIGSATTAAASTETIVSCRCCPASVGMLSLPCHWSWLVRKSKTSPRNPITPPPYGACACRARRHGVARRSASTSSRSATTARASESTMPTVSGVRKSRCRPSSMSAPSPPWPISAVTVTNPMVVTVAIRMPTMMAGSANGSSTRSRRRDREYPMPVAASLTSTGTPSRPVTVFRTRISNV